MPETHLDEHGLPIKAPGQAKARPPLNVRLEPSYWERIDEVILHYKEHLGQKVTITDVVRAAILQLHRRVTSAETTPAAPADAQDAPEAAPEQAQPAEAPANGSAAAHRSKPAGKPAAPRKVKGQ